MGITVYPDPDSAYVICSSSTRPSSPFGGQMIFESDTGKTLVYNTDALTPGWYPPWNTAWGLLDYNTGAGTAFDATTPTQVTSGTVNLYSGRNYRVVFSMQARTAVSDTLISFNLGVSFNGGAFNNVRDFRGTFTLGSAINTTETFLFDHFLQSGSDQTLQARYTTTRATATASVTTPIQVEIWIEDIGSGGP